MNRVDELIKKLCPNGVEFRTLGSLAEVRSGWGFPARYQGRKTGELPFYKVKDMNSIENRFVMGKAENYISLEEADKLSVNFAPAGTIIFPKIGAAIRTNKKRILSRDSAYDNNVMGIVVGDGLISQYVLHLFSNLRLETLANDSGAVPSIRKTTVENLMIPVPPLEIQQEIARILDKFTQLEAELEAELEARRKQYAYYRDRILSFSQGNIRWEQLSELATIGTGKHDTKDAVVGGEYIFYARGRQPLRLNSFDFDEDAIITAGDGAGVGKVFHFVTGKYALHQRAYRIVPNERIHPRYLYHYLLTDFARYLEKTSVHASVTSLRRAMFLKYPVPVPEISEQYRIVAILDKFDALVNDISTGLPAEIAARRKQYEYYRDKLLSFEPAAAAQQ